MSTAVIRAECDQIDADFSLLNVQLAVVTAERDNLAAQVATLQATIAENTAAIAARDAEIVRLNNQIVADDVAIDLKDAEIASLQAEIKRLNNIINPPPPWDYYVMPGGAGDGSEASPASPGTIDAAIASIGPGARIGLLPGTYSYTSINISHGGTEAAPVIIGCVDGIAQFVGSRSGGVPDLDTHRDIGDGTTIWKRPWELPDWATAEYWQPTNAASWGSHGAEVFRLQTGADWLTFRHIRVDRQKWAWNFIGNITGIVIEDCGGFNAEDFVYQNYTAPNGAKNVIIRRCDFTGFDNSAVRWNGASDGLLVEDVVGNSGFQTGGSFAMGVFISDVAKNAICRRVTMRNCLDVQSMDNTKYWNGDGFTTERGTTGLVFEDCLAENCSDGGFDSKSEGAQFIRCTARNNKRNFRVWASSTLDHCVSETPHKTAILNSGGPTKTGGTGSPADLWIEGGVDAAHPTNVTLIGWTPGITAKEKPSAAAAFYGQVIVQ